MHVAADWYISSMFHRYEEAKREWISIEILAGWDADGINFVRHGAEDFRKD